MRRTWWVLLAAAACAKRGAPPAPSTAPREDVTAWVGAAQKAAIADVDGQPGNEVVLADSQALRVVTPAGKELATTPAPGGIQVLAAADLDGDGRAEVLAGWGMTRDRKDGQVRVSVYRLAGGSLTEETLPLAPAVDRQDVAAIVPAGKGLIAAYFASKYMVKAVTAQRGDGGWTVQDLAELRTAGSWARGDVDGDGQPDVVVGRVYGDEKDVDGDAFVLRPDGGRAPIPTTRGVRGLAITDIDGDGKGDIFLGDGWHQNYGQVAKGLLTWSRWQDGAFHSQLVEDAKGQFTIWRVLPADVDGDGKPEIVAQGSSNVRVYKYAGGKWEAQTVGQQSRDVAVGDLDGRPGDEILILGDKSEIVRLYGAGGSTWGFLPPS